MSRNNVPNKNTALVEAEKVITGVDKYFASVSVLTIAGTSYTPTSLKAVFQADIDATKALDAGRAQVKQQVVAGSAARAKAREVRQGLKSYILGNYGAGAVTMLEDFGMSVPKPSGKKTVAVKAKALASAEATRKARHTMGKQQKKLIKGVTTQPATPEPAPAQPANAAPSKS